MRIEQVNEASPELVETISALLPQLTEARTPPTLGQLQDVVSNQTLLLARDHDGGIRASVSCGSRRLIVSTSSSVASVTCSSFIAAAARAAGP